ncbi:MAG: sulfatase-like hydrolase/transferase [Polyangiaceae bacterium]
MLDSALAGARRLVAHLPLRLGWLNVVLTLLAGFSFWRFDLDRRGGLPTNWSTVAFAAFATLLTVNLEVQLALALGGRRHGRRIAFGLALLSLTILLLAYHQKTTMHFDPSVVLDQEDVPLSREVLFVVGSAFHGWTIAFGVVAIAGLCVLDRCSSRTFPEQSGNRWLGSIVLLLALTGVQYAPYPPRGELSVLARTLVARQSKPATDYVLPRGYYPLLRKGKQTNDAASKAHPDVFVVLVESFNVNVVGAKGPNGLELTPFFNALIPQGLYVDRFYGNSVQTAKGHFATLCSVIPSIRGREFVQYAKVHFKCLPRVLRDAGYHTEFFQAYRDLRYDNTKGFLSRNGFQHVESVSKHQHPEDKASSWGWGLQDDIFYQRFFEHLDRDYPEVGERKPIFATLAPISNHMRFDGVPVQLRKHYPQASTPKEHFSNSVSVADRGLEVFVRELSRRSRFRDAIVVITGDHSFPIGEHDFFYNETEAYEEFFRIPLLMYSPGTVAPERITNLAFSQLDIAPTLLDLVGVHPKETHFMGTSLLERPLTNHPVFLVQPYAGVFLGVVEYPFKYIYRLSTKETRLYDLRSDPTEKNNIALEPGRHGMVEHLHDLLRHHFHGQSGSRYGSGLAAQGLRSGRVRATSRAGVGVENTRTSEAHGYPDVENPD